MGQSAYIACMPMPKLGEEGRHSNNFCVNQLPHLEHLKWHVITTSGEDQGVSFNVKEHYTYKENEMRFEHIKEGSITPYVPYRNLYIADAQDIRGHFIVRVEACE